MGCLFSHHSHTGSAYTVNISSGDTPQSKNDTFLYIILHGDELKTKRHLLDVKFKCCKFKRGQIASFGIDDTQLENISYIEFWQDTSLNAKTWFIDSITVSNNQTNQTLPFPVFQRIDPQFKYRIKPYDTSLPQNVHGEWKELRQKELQCKRTEYKVIDSYKKRPLPRNEDFSNVYFNKTILDTTFKDVKKMMHIGPKHWKTIKDVKGIFGIGRFTAPVEMDRWCNDVLFGAQRLRGTNPMQIKLCKEIPDNFYVNTEDLTQFLEGQSFQDALDARKIFIIDYACLKSCPTKCRLTVCAPIALFYLRQDGDLIPIAIQLFQEKADNNPVFMPSDPKYTWIMAKMWFNNADAQVHEEVAHLGFTHLIMEDILITVNRNISPSHPVYKLLAPHFLYLMAINHLAREVLIPKNGLIDDLLTIGADGVQHLYTQARKDWRMDVDGTLPENLKLRGVLDESILPNYFSRDDAMALYTAIHQYATEYIHLYYKNDDMILADDEIQAWRAETVKPEQDGGYGIKGLPGEDGKFTTREHLVIAVTSFIHTCSVDHAMVNFMQYDAYAFPPNYPATLIGNPPRDKQALTESDIVHALPGRKDVFSLLNLMSMLSTRATLPLGRFEVNYIFDPEAQPIVEHFRKNLIAVGKIMEGRNRNRHVSYDCLLPQYVPNAISI